VLHHFFSHRLFPCFQDEATGETRIGLSYDRLCQTIKVGNSILIADGTIVIEVLEILSEKTLLGKVWASPRRFPYPTPTIKPFSIFLSPWNPCQEGVVGKA
jgi:Pyruvate kinase, barrel domain